MMDARYTRQRLAVLSSYAVLCVAGCAAPGPASPTVLALPAQGENFTLFQQHEQTCRSYASAQTGGQTPGQAQARSGLGGAVLGTGLGAAAGALLGSAGGHAGTGAAIGAGTGLLAGGLLGTAHGRDSAATVQTEYNNAYVQCMVAQGERVPPATRPVIYAPPPAIYVPAPVYVVPPAYVVPPGRPAGTPG